MMALLLEPLQFTFMSHALLISLVVSIPCALLSVFLVLKSWALMGDAMSHAVFPGIVLAWILGLPLATGAFVAGVFCAVATGYLKDNSRIKQDTVMGIVFSGMFAAGLILYIAVKPDVHLDHILFGDMLGITIGDIIQTVIIAGLVTLVISVKWRDFLLFSFDYQQAQASGLHTRWLHYGLLCMVSLTIVATLKAVGIILSISLLIAPGAIAVLLTQRFHIALLLATGISILVSMTGVWLSFFIDSAPAPTIVVLFAVMFIMQISNIMNAGFDSVYNLYNETVYDVADIIDTLVYRLGVTDGKYEQSTAVGLFKNVINFILLVSGNWLTKKMCGYSMYSLD